MRIAKRLSVLSLAVLSLYFSFSLGLFDGALDRLRMNIEAGRMQNVKIAGESVTTATETDLPAPVEPEPMTAEPSETMTAEPEPLAAVMESIPEGEIRETTIQGGVSIKNETDYRPDISALILGGAQISLPAEGPQILIIHTHGSEAYTQAGLDRYEAEDNNRTADTSCNIIRVGDELAAKLEQGGLRVLHDRGIYDYPSYTGSYSRSGEAIQEYLRQYPDIAVVIDLHRDALGSNGVIYKTVAEEEGVCASQVMILVGTDESGLEHENWQKNLSLALYLQNAVNEKHPTLMRPVSLVQQRYNQHLTTGSLIVEVGSSGNTLQEALAAIRLFADAVSPALAALTEQSE